MTDKEAARAIADAYKILAVAAEEPTLSRLALLTAAASGAMPIGTEINRVRQAIWNLSEEINKLEKHFSLLAESSPLESADPPVGSVTR